MASKDSTLNLTDNSVTREQYQSALTSLAEFLTSLGYRQGWCGERHSYFRAIYPEWDSYQERQPNFARTPVETDDAGNDVTDYGRLLRAIRARVLWYVSRGRTELDTANDAFRLMGIPTYPDKAPEVPPQEYTAELTRIRLAAVSPDMDAETMRRWLQVNLPAVIISAMGGEPFTGDNHIIPGSFRIGDSAYVYTEDQESPAIDAADIERPNYDS